MTDSRQDTEADLADQREPSLAPREDPDTLLSQVEGDLTTTEYGFQRARVFRRVAELLRAQGRAEEGQRAEWQSWLFDFMLVSRDERRSRGYGRFAPMIEMNGQAYPHASAFPPASLLAFKDELDRSINPIHRAFYADFIWDQREKYLGSTKDTAQAAKIAIDAYLMAARQYRQNGWNNQLADAIDRAAELAMSIRDIGRVDLCKGDCFGLAEELIGERQHPAVRWAIDALETLQRFKRHLVPEDHERIIAAAEAGATYYSDAGNYHIQRSFLALLPESHHALGMAVEASNALARHAETFTREADEAHSAIARLHIYGQALEAYQNLGDSEKADELKRRVSQAGVEATGEMKTVSAEVRIPTEVAEAWVRQLMTLGLQDALRVLSATDRFFPKVEQIRLQAADSRQKYPLQYLVSRRTLDSAGRIVQKALSDEEQVSASEADAYQFALAFTEWELGMAFDRLESEKGLTAEALMELLRSRPTFEPSTLDMVAVGVDRYFAGDYVSALHVLVPQLEDTLRDILATLDIARTSARQGLTFEKPLQEVLATLELRQGLGEDLATFFERFLIRQESENLRHRTAHGLLKLEHCTQQLARRVLYCFLQLGNLTLVVSDVTGDADEHEIG